MMSLWMNCNCCVDTWMEEEHPEDRSLIGYIVHEGDMTQSEAPAPQAESEGSLYLGREHALWDRM